MKADVSEFCVESRDSSGLTDANNQKHPWYSVTFPRFECDRSVTLIRRFAAVSKFYGLIFI